MPPPALSHCKVCDLPDFADPELRKLIRDIYSADAEHFGPEEFPAGHEYRKYWEVAMTARAFGQLGVLREDAGILGVGAGHEATVFWLTRHVGSVMATDLYNTDDAWSERDSGSTMLDDPGQFWDSEWRPERLTVRHMNGLELDFPDECFDGVFSSSSIEHFGQFADVRRAVEEIYRVLKPGGVAALSTEFRLEGPSMNYHPGVLLFDEAEMRSLLFDGLWWDPASPFDASITEETRTSETLFMDAVEDSKSGKERWSSYPHIVLRHDPFVWTSFHVALVKSGATAEEWRRRAPELPPKVEAAQQRKDAARALRDRVLAALGRVRLTAVNRFKRS